MPVDKSQRLANVGFGVSEYDDPAPAFLDTLGAAFRQENLIGSVAVDHTTDISSFELNRVEKGYNPYEGDILKGYEDYVDHFTESYNPQKTDAIKANIDREREDRQILDESGLTGAALSMGAAMADPTILVPGGALVRSGRVGYGALKSAGAVALGAASGAAVQEAGLQATQEIRSGIESAAAIGGSAILGGAFGFGIAKFLTKGEWTRLSAIARNEALGMENRLSPEVKSSVKKSLEDIGMSSDEADANATLYGSFYQTMSDRAGMSIDTMMKRYPLPELKKAAAADAEEGLFQSSPAIDTPEFKSWFGDSKVVDADGKPLVVYHGTGEKLDFFDPDLADGDLGIFFSSSKALAREYAGAGDGVVHETYLTLNNPFIIDWPSETKSFEVDGNVLENKRFNDYSMFDYGTMRDVVYRARQGGHDGIIIKGIRDGWNADSEVADTYVAFNSTQIKSVNNRGTFDPNDARILYQATLRKKLTKARGKMQGLLDFVRSNPGDKTKTVEVAKVSDGIANIIKEQTGIDVHGFDHTIDAHAIRHIFKRHGNAKVEKSRGQVAITDADIEAIPELLSRATHVVTGLEPWRGRERFGYLSESADGRFYYIEEARTGRRQMANVSMRKMPPGIKSDEIINSLISTSETLPGDGRLGRSFVESNPSKAIRITEIPDNAKPWLYQGGVKGSIHLPKGPDSKAVISLFETANKSTFLHETGHFFLSVMDDMARAGDAPSDIKGMRDTVRGWWKDNGDAIATEAGEGHSKADIEDWLEFGTTGDAAKDEAISRATHEQFARAFETYLGTGKAPTPELKNVFERFAEWLKEVYGNLANLNVQPSDEVRKVFDDMLAYDDPVDVIDIGVSRMQSVGASSVDEIDISDLGVGGGKPAQSVAKATEYLAINPGVQTMYSPSKTVRTTYQQMVDNGIYTKMEMEGKTLGPSAENLVKQLQRGALAKWIGETKDLWKQARKAGWDGTKKDFYTRIARAARRGDTDEFGNEFVSKAAQNAREYIFDPTLQQAIDAGLLPDDVHVTTAMSYLTRMWNRQMLIAQEDKFRAIAKRYFSDMLDKVQFRQDEAKAGKTVVRALDAEEKLQQALSRLDSFEVRLKEREAVRADKLGAIKQKESARTKLLSSRPSRDVLKAVSEAKDSDTLITVMKGIPKAPKAVKKPLLAKLKAMGGVDKNSMLADELRAIGVSSHTAPGLFKANGGLKAVDNLVASEDDLFRNFPTDANGYVNQEAILDAIADEMAGNPIRSDEALAFEAAEENISEWLKSIGLDDGATIGDVRKHLNEISRAEKGLSEIDRAITRMEQDLDRFDEATEWLRRERLTAEGEAKNFSDALEDLEKEIAGIRDLVDASPKVKIMVDYALARRAYGKARYEQVKVENRIKAIDGVEKVGKLTDDLYFERQKLWSQKTDIDGRVIKAKEQADKLKAMTPDIRKELPEFIDDADRDDYIDEVIVSVFDNLTGRGGGDVPDYIVPVTRGPLKERTFNIPDEMVEDFLENDMEQVLRYYTRTMGAEVELAKKFGRADMKDQLEAISREYDDLRLAAKSEKEKNKLTKAEKRDIQNLTAFRDLIRGTYRAAEESSDWTRITRAALTWNYMRLLGGVTLTSMTDAARLVGVHGLRATMREALPALVSGIKSAKISRADARDLGAITEAVLQTRLASLADIQDPYAHGSVYERFLSNASNVFSKATGLAYWNDGMKTIASVMTQNRMAKNAMNWKAAGKNEQAYMAFLGIDEMMAGRIAKQIQRHGIQEKGIWGANVSKWDDAVAARTWAAALNKDVDRTIVTKGVADQPLWTRTNTGKLITQFKSFALATHQRVLIAGLQENPLRLAENMVFASALGMMIGYLKYIERGDEAGANRLIENPGLWVTEGLDRSGILAVPFEISNSAEKLGIPFGIQTGMQAAAGDPDRSGSVSRYAQRNQLGVVLGPSAGAFQDIATIASQLSKGDLKKSGVGAIIRQVPGGSLPGVRTGMYAGVKPWANEAVE